MTRKPNRFGDSVIVSYDPAKPDGPGTVLWDGEAEGLGIEHARTWPRPDDLGRVMTIDPIAYYSPETHLFPELAQSFAATGSLDPVALYLILDWKAPRARTRHRSRLAGIAGSFNAAVAGIAADRHTAAGPEQRLWLLLVKWGFQLPTASAILAVLYPDTFTVYDIRVCDALGTFHRLGDVKWSPEAWEEYQRFAAAVRGAAPQGLSLRDCDRWLWGRDKRAALLKELAA